MAITIDLGGPTAGHPTNKAEFAWRLSRLALHDVYHQPLAEWSGPLFRSADRHGDKIAVTFAHAAGLKASSGDLKGFAIAAADRKFVWANAKVMGDQVILWGDDAARSGRRAVCLGREPDVQSDQCRGASCFAVSHGRLEVRGQAGSHETSTSELYPRVTRETAMCVKTSHVDDWLPVVSPQSSQFVETVLFS